MSILYTPEGLRSRARALLSKCVVNLGVNRYISKQVLDGFYLQRSFDAFIDD